MKRRKIAMLHYTYPPVIGGVETVVQAHAKLLTEKGWEVKIITGEGGKEDNIYVKVVPELKALSLFEEDLSKKLKKGEVPEKFYKLKEHILQKIKSEIEDMDVCIIHNVMTMHFNLPFTCAVDELINTLSSRVKFYIWCHDSALLNPTYMKDIPSTRRYPWNLLSTFNPHALYVTISKQRQMQLARIFSVSPEKIQVVPGGIDLKSFLNISDNLWQFALDRGILESEISMFFPSRILKRKNYELGIYVVEEMKKRGKNCRFLITAPPDPHNPETMDYFNFLHKLCARLNVEKEVIFLYDWKKYYNLKLDYEEIKQLYSVCDVLFVTSLEEGFGIPLIEAGAKKLPIIYTNIRSLEEIAGEYALRIDPQEKISGIVTKILNYLESLPTFLMFKKVVLNYWWESIYKNYFKKLVDQHAKNRNC